MDHVKREDNSVIDEETYKMYIDTLNKTFVLDTIDHQHTPLSMEQLHQAMHSSLDTRSLVHNFQIPLSPRQLSTLRLKSNQKTRPLNYELPSHLPKNLSMEMEHISVPSDMPQSLLRHNDFLAPNLDITLARNIMSEVELQNNLQIIQDHELARNMTTVNDLSQNVNRDIQHELGNELDLSHLNRTNLATDVLNQEDTRKNSSIQTSIDNHLLEQQMLLKLEQNMPLRIDQSLDQLSQRIDQTLTQRMDHNLSQRLDQSLAHRLDQILPQRTFNPGTLHEQKLEHNQMFSVSCQIKAEQEDDGYFYKSMNQGIGGVGLTGEIPQHTESSQTTNIHQDQIYSLYNNQIPIPALNTIDLYSRQQSYIQNYMTDMARENPQNLVVQRQYEHHSPYNEHYKKLRQDGDVKKDLKNEDPKENMKPPNQNKNFYEYNEFNVPEKNENDSNSNTKAVDDPVLNIKGEYSCYKCNEAFPSKRLLKQHARTCENGENTELEKLGKFCCSQCSYRCQSPAILKIHERTHTGEKPYACSFCDYKSGQKNNVAKHMLVHMKQKPFECQYCDYRCAQKNNLVVHERTHTGFKPFACPYCEYRTVQKPNLVKHMYLHTDQKPFSCDLCNYRCVQKTNLIKHKQRHINEKDGDKFVHDPGTTSQVKPYKPRQRSIKCEHCSYRCVQKSSLEKHLQFKHGDLKSDNAGSLNLMKESDSIQNLSVKKPDFVTDKVLETLPDKVLETLPSQT
ncbi:zinc finger protein 468-like [Melitaea cinxia]|uniref:zinc finger protein 468-like n=1 Tax=Melitaea cinxia TaxID=113334 RepID=UPI001E270AC8|nr:zinc finger protein 468-like [Melitaea cinxia]